MIEMATDALQSDFFGDFAFIILDRCRVAGMLVPMAIEAIVDIRHQKVAALLRPPCRMAGLASGIAGEFALNPMALVTEPHFGEVVETQPHRRDLIALVHILGLGIDDDMTAHAPAARKLVFDLGVDSQPGAFLGSLGTGVKFLISRRIAGEIRNAPERSVLVHGRRIERFVREIILDDHHRLDRLAMRKLPVRGLRVEVELMAGGAGLIGRSCRRRTVRCVEDSASQVRSLENQS